MAIAGKVAITPKGEWNDNTAYTKLDLVFYDNASYVAIQPSTGVEPTNTSYWMLVVQSAGGADLEAIINGTTQVGNAKTLDGHEAEYFAKDADLANYLPLTGGEIDGSLTSSSSEATNRGFYAKNPLKRVGFQVKADGTAMLHDHTNGKDILTNALDGTNTFNGTASGNLPLTGGTVTSPSDVILSLGSTHTNKRALVKYLNGSTNYGYLGFTEANKPTYASNTGALNELLHTGNMASHVLPRNGGRLTSTNNSVLELESTNADQSVVIRYIRQGTTLGYLGYNGTELAGTVNGQWCYFLHTGNKPTGTYTGNGDATQRTIETGGIGSVAMIYSSYGYAFLTTNGAVVITSSGSVTFTTDAYFDSGKIVTKTNNAVINGSGNRRYQVL